MQIAALLVKVYLPPAGPGQRRALQQSGSLGAFSVSAERVVSALLQGCFAHFVHVRCYLAAVEAYIALE